MSETRIRGVFFDLDGTLFDRDAAVRGLVEEQYTSFATDLTRVPRENFIASVASLDAHGHRSKSEIYSTVCSEFGLPGSLGDRLMADFWHRYHHFCQPCQGLAETLQELRRRGKKIGLITNGESAVQEGTIDALSIRQFMDAILVSETEGVRKPHRDIFERAAARVGLTTAECCYVGDHPDIDIVGARAAGLYAIWRRTRYWDVLETVPTIDELADVLLHV